MLNGVDTGRGWKLENHFILKIFDTCTGIKKQDKASLTYYEITLVI